MLLLVLSVHITNARMRTMHRFVCMRKHVFTNTCMRLQSVFESRKNVKDIPALRLKLSEEDRRGKNRPSAVAFEVRCTVCVAACTSHSYCHVLLSCHVTCDGVNCFEVQQNQPCGLSRVLLCNCYARQPSLITCCRIERWFTVTVSVYEHTWLLLAFKNVMCIWRHYMGMYKSYKSSCAAVVQVLCYPMQLS